MKNVWANIVIATFEQKHDYASVPFDDDVPNHQNKFDAW